MRILLISKKTSAQPDDPAELRRVHLALVQLGQSAVWCEHIVKDRWDWVIVDHSILDNEKLLFEVAKMKCRKMIWVMDHCGNQCPAAMQRGDRLRKCANIFNIIATQDCTVQWSRHMWLVQAVQTDEWRMPVHPINRDEVFDICFIGNAHPKSPYYPERYKIIRDLGKKYKVLVMGLNRISGCAHLPTSFKREDYQRCCEMSKVQLILPQAEGSHNYISNRIFFAGMARSCPVVWRADGMQEWVPKEYWFSRKELDFALSKPAARDTLTASLHQHVITKHTYKQRAELILRRMA